MSADTQNVRGHLMSDGHKKSAHGHEKLSPNKAPSKTEARSPLQTTLPGESTSFPSGAGEANVSLTPSPTKAPSKTEARSALKTNLPGESTLSRPGESTVSRPGEST